ncbi:MAG: S8 family serine peptidase [candidate division WOR-3 bacterium]|nr:S8 family serine peptidase [candidate division WOR-3 bacterium]
MNVITLLLLTQVGRPFLAQTSVEPYENAHLVMLLSETIDTRLSPSLAEGSGSRFIVKFDHPPTGGDQSTLENSGLTIEGYLPHYAYLVSGETQAVHELLDAQTISWASTYEPRWKLAPGLASGEDPTDTLHVLLFTDADLAATVRLVENLSGVIHSAHDGVNKTLMISVDEEHLSGIASLDAVRWIEPFYAPHFHNNQAQWVLQSWQEESHSLWDRGLDGEGVVLSTGDSGINTGHVMYRDSTIQITDWGDYPGHRKIIAYQPSAPEASFGDHSSASYHGTHTGCTVCGEDSYWGKTAPYDGIAPKAKLYFIDVGSSSSIAYPSDYNDMYLMAWTGNEGGRAKLMSNSWGSNGSFSIYDIPCRQTDEFVWNHPDFLVLFSAGNSSSSGIKPPATAKNVVAVGASLNGTSATIPAGFSSIGPTADGRIKPTVTAPGYLTSANGGTPDGYQWLMGTSMSCPAVAGACAMVVQYLREGWYPSGAPNAADSIEPSAALLRAMLISSTIADFASNPIPDPKIGWGRVCLDSVLYFDGEANRLYLDDNTTQIGTGEEVLYHFDIDGRDRPLRVTLAWSDPPAEMAAAKKIVNDLDLQAESPSGKIYRGNVFASNFSITGGSADATNVEECIRVKNPEEGNWRVSVIGTNIPQGPQPFALVITGEIRQTGVEEGEYIHIQPSLQLTTNPFTNQLIVQLYTTHAGPLILEMFDQTGRKIMTLVDEKLYPEGEKTFSFNLQDSLPSGIYFLRLKTCGKQVISKAVHLK